MILSDSQIKSETILVRFYNYSDADAGYGDSGTAAYFRILTSDLVEVETKKFNGDKYYTYSLSEATVDKLQNFLGPYWGYGIGYEAAKESDRQDEIDRLRKTLEAVETVQSI